MQIKDVMSTSVVAVTPTTTLKDVAHTLLDRHVAGVPVVADGCVVGFVSESDVVAAEQAPHEAEPVGRLAHVFHRQAHEHLRPTVETAGDAMSSPAIVASIQKRGPVAPSRRWSRLLSRSDCSVSGSAPATRSADSRVHPLANTLRRRRSRRSTGSSRSWLQAGCRLERRRRRGPRARALRTDGAAGRSDHARQGGFVTFAELRLLDP